MVLPDWTDILDHSIECLVTILPQEPVRVPCLEEQRHSCLKSAPTTCGFYLKNKNRVNPTLSI
jgi:hypothetical protein